MLFLQMNVCYQCIGIHNSKELNIYLYSHWCCKMDYKRSVASKRPSEIPTMLVLITDIDKIIVYVKRLPFLTKAVFIEI